MLWSRERENSVAVDNIAITIDNDDLANVAVYNGTVEQVDVRLLHTESYEKLIPQQSIEIKSLKESVRSSIKQSLIIFTKTLDLVKSFLLYTKLVWIVAIFSLIGAYMFMWLEVSTDLEAKREAFEYHYVARNVVLHKIMLIHDENPYDREQQWKEAILQFESSMGIELPDPEKTDWTFEMAMLYAGTIYTTIGYGNISCKTTAGRLASIIYGIIGIPLLLQGDQKSLLLVPPVVVLDRLGIFFLKHLKSGTIFIDDLCLFFGVKFGVIRVKDKDTYTRYIEMTRYLAKKGFKFLEKQDIKKTSSLLDIERGKSAETLPRQASIPLSDFNESNLSPKSKAEEEEDVKRNPPMAAALIVTIGWIFTTSAFFMLWEGWDYFTAVYFCFISLLTIGFGDISPANPQYSILTFVIVIVGLALVTVCINVAQEKIAQLYMRILEKMLEDYKKAQESGDPNATKGFMTSFNTRTKFLMPLVTKKSGMKAMEHLKKEAEKQGIELPPVLTEIDPETGKPAFADPKVDIDDFLEKAQNEGKLTPAVPLSPTPRPLSPRPTIQMISNETQTPKSLAESVDSGIQCGTTWSSLEDVSTQVKIQTKNTGVQPEVSCIFTITNDDEDDDRPPWADFAGVEDDEIKLEKDALQTRSADEDYRYMKNASNQANLVETIDSVCQTVPKQVHGKKSQTRLTSFAIDAMEYQLTKKKELIRLREEFMKLKEEREKRSQSERTQSETSGKRKIVLEEDELLSLKEKLVEMRIEKVKDVLMTKDERKKSIDFDVDQEKAILMDELRKIRKQKGVSLPRFSTVDSTMEVEEEVFIVPEVVRDTPTPVKTIKRQVSEILSEYELKEYEETSTSPLTIIVEEYPGPSPKEPEYHLTQEVEEPIIKEKYEEVTLNVELIKESVSSMKSRTVSFASEDIPFEQLESDIGFDDIFPTFDLEDEEENMDAEIEHFFESTDTQTDFSIFNIRDNFTNTDPMKYNNSAQTELTILSDSRPQIGVQVERLYETEISTQTFIAQMDQFVEAFLPLAEYATIGIDPMLGPMEDKLAQTELETKEASVDVRPDLEDTGVDPMLGPMEDKLAQTELETMETSVDVRPDLEDRGVDSMIGPMEDKLAQTVLETMEASVDVRPDLEDKGVEPMLDYMENKNMQTEVYTEEKSIEAVVEVFEVEVQYDFKYGENSTQTLIENDDKATGTEILWEDKATEPDFTLYQTDVETEVDLVMEDKETQHIVKLVEVEVQHEAENYEIGVQAFVDQNFVETQTDEFDFETAVVQEATPWSDFDYYGYGVPEEEEEIVIEEEKIDRENLTSVIEILRQEFGVQVHVSVEDKASQTGKELMPRPPKKKKISKSLDTLSLERENHMERATSPIETTIKRSISLETIRIETESVEAQTTAKRKIKKAKAHKLTQIGPGELHKQKDIFTMTDKYKLIENGTQTLLRGKNLAISEEDLSPTTTAQRVPRRQSVTPGKGGSLLEIPEERKQSPAPLKRRKSTLGIEERPPPEMKEEEVQAEIWQQGEYGIDWMSFLKGYTPPQSKAKVLVNVRTQSEPTLFMEDHATQTTFKPKPKTVESTEPTKLRPTETKREKSKSEITAPKESHSTQSEIRLTKTSIQTDDMPEPRKTRSFLSLPTSDAEIQVQIRSRSKERLKSMAEHEAQIGIPYTDRRHSSSQYEKLAYETQSKILKTDFSSQSTPDLQETSSQTVEFLEIQPKWLKVAGKLVETSMETERVIKTDIGVQKMIKKKEKQETPVNPPPIMISIPIQTDLPPLKSPSESVHVQTERKKFAEIGIQTKTISPQMAEKLKEAGLGAELSQYTVEEPQKLSPTRTKRHLKPSASSKDLASQEQETFLSVSEHPPRRYSIGRYEGMQIGDEEELPMSSTHESGTTQFSSFLDTQPSPSWKVKPSDLEPGRRERMMDIGIQTGVLARVQHILGQRGKPGKAHAESETTSTDTYHRMHKVALRKISSVDSLGKKSDKEEVPRPGPLLRRQSSKESRDSREFREMFEVDIPEVKEDSGREMAKLVARHGRFFERQQTVTELKKRLEHVRAEQMGAGTTTQHDFPKSISSSDLKELKRSSSFTETEQQLFSLPVIETPKITEQQQEDVPSTSQQQTSIPTRFAIDPKDLEKPRVKRLVRKKLPRVEKRDDTDGE